MRYKDPQSGKVFKSITQALEAFKCPGPCDPDCPLYEAAKLSSGLWAHKCHHEWATAHPVQTAHLIGYEILSDSTKRSNPPCNMTVK